MHNGLYNPAVIGNKHEAYLNFPEKRFKQTVERVISGGYVRRPLIRRNRAARTGRRALNVLPCDALFYKMIQQCIQTLLITQPVCR